MQFDKILLWTNHLNLFLNHYSLLYRSSNLISAFCPVSLKTNRWFQRWRFFKSCHWNFTSKCILILSPLKKGVTLHLLNPLHSRMLYTKFGWNWLYGSRNLIKCVKFTEGQTARRWTKVIRAAHLYFQLNELKKTKTVEVEFKIEIV